VEWRRGCPVLVSEAHAIGSLAVIRSLGRAGYPVVACSSQPDAIGRYSNYTDTFVQCPSYNDSAAFSSWVRQTVRHQRIQTIVPSEGMLLALRPAFDEFRHLMPCSQSEALLYRDMSKFDLYSSFGRSTCPSTLRKNLPPYLLVEEGSELPTMEEMRALGIPLYAKLDACHARDGGSGFVKKMPDPARWRDELSALRVHYRKILLQGHVPGIGVGVFFLRWNGEVLARFMHKRLHEVPHTGGVSSFRRSWWHESIYRDALERVTYLDGQGVAMLEYRWDPQADRFYLLEMNSRFWGSLHLSLYAGVDFPRLLLDAFHGHKETVRDFDKTTRCRLTFPKEMEYVWSCLKDHDLSWGKRLWSVLEFAALSVNPTVRSDLWFPGDRGIFWLMLLRSVRKFLSPTEATPT